MSGHKAIRDLMYEYLCDELDQHDRGEVESHLASCSRCQWELKDLRTALDLFPAQAAKPSDQRSPEFWKTFASTIDTRAREEESKKRKSRPPLWEIIESMIMFRPGLAVAIAGAFALIGAAVLGWHMYSRIPPEVVQPQIVQPVAEESPAQLDQYLRKSKVLLVGIANLKEPEGEAIDLSTERRVSRQLLLETKSLRRQPLDSRSIVLVDNLEKVFNELANAGEDKGFTNVELVRTTIRQENLLFKIRMAEATHDLRFTVKTGGESRQGRK
jgi:hypothetical protein